MTVEDEALVNEVTRLEAELLQLQQARRVAEAAQLEAVVVRRAEVDAARAQVKSLEEEAANLEREVLGDRVARDESMAEARSAEAHVDELKAVGATSKAPAKYW